VNKRGFFHWIIIIIILLVLTGVIYFKFSSSGVEIGSKATANSINLGYNGTINQIPNNETPSTPSLNYPANQGPSDNISIVGR